MTTVHDENDNLIDQTREGAREEIEIERERERLREKVDRDNECKEDREEKIKSLKMTLPSILYFNLRV